MKSVADEFEENLDHSQQITYILRKIRDLAFFDVFFQYVDVKKLPKSVFLYKARNSNDKILILLPKNTKSRNLK